jgi:DNA-binding response OmpR family regulator
MKKMLVVEDNVLSQGVMRRTFRNDFEIDVCESAEEYYENYSKVNYDIIIMDISLKGGKTGLELTKEIKASPSYTGAPVLCLTAHAQTKMRQTAIESGTDYFITKPVATKILKEVVKFLLQSVIKK